jgi:hypothetical protein
MAVKWEILHSVLVLTSSGYGGQGTVAALTEAISDPRFRPGLALLFDRRLATDDANSAEMRSRAKFLASLLPLGISHRCALVAGPRPHQYGIARMEAAHLEFQGMELEVFSDVNEALMWLAQPTTANSETN